MIKYLCDPHVIPTIVPRDVLYMQSYASIVATFCDTLHIDIADGMFAPSTTWPFEDQAQMRGLKDIQGPLVREPRILEAHLMTTRENASTIVPLLAERGVQRVIIHIEALTDIDSSRALFVEWKATGLKEVGLGVLLATSLDVIDPYVPEIDVVHMMSISEIGQQGKPFDERALHRVEEMHARYPDMMVAIDGGVSEATVESLVRAGANRMVVGAAIAQSTDPADTYRRIWERAMKGCAPIQTELAI
ncbi:hypothetical protein HY970_01335 [Candidatus Kaiserbacteria bacterium]|nr:hypothetical protein [Candidatus Kaiserbacteria bacterium]